MKLLPLLIAAALGMGSGGSRTATIVVTVLSGGGPALHKPSRLANGEITVSRNGVVVATARHGMLDRRLAPGRYEVKAALPTVRCEARSVRLKSGSITRLHLYCSIK
jgi:hypothetical protein